MVSGAGVPDPPKAPQVTCKSAYSALVSWEPPVNNGATVTEYRLEWQQKTEVTDFAMVRHYRILFEYSVYKSFQSGAHLLLFYIPVV